MFEPRIIGFLCNWCAYAGADLAGVSRFQYPPNVRIVRVMCSGRVDPVLILEAFKQGADGVLVGGCHPGDCHYEEGNHQAEKKVKCTKKILGLEGIERERVRLEWVSASEGKKWADVIDSFTEKVREMGPLSEGEEDKMPLLKDVGSESRVRSLISKEREITELGNAYGETVPQDEFDNLLDEAIEKAYRVRRILREMEEDPRSAKEISQLLDIDSETTVNLIVDLRRKGRVELSTVEGTSPKYIWREG